MLLITVKLRAEINFFIFQKYVEHAYLHAYHADFLPKLHSLKLDVMKLIKNPVDVWLKNHHVEFLSTAALFLVDFWSWLAQISKTLPEIFKKVGACQSLRQFQEKVYFGMGGRGKKNS